MNLPDLFVVLLDGRANDGRGLWRLTAPFSVFSEVAERWITVPAGIETDFATVPNLPIAAELFAGTARKAAVVHDYLYKTASLPRSLADRVFAELGVREGYSAEHMEIMRVAVEDCGAPYYCGEDDYPPKHQDVGAV